MRLNLLALAAFSLTSLAAHADDLFTYTYGGETLTFTLPSSPTPKFYIAGQSFLVTNVAYTFNGVGETGGFVFYNSNYGGGLSGATFNLEGQQIYSGQESAPTFLPGTYILKNDNITPGTLTIASTAVTPEPSSLVLLGTGLAGLLGLARRKVARAG